MAGDIDKIRRDVSLIETARSCGVELEADGLEWVSCCPFHSEDTPSFTLFQGKDHTWRFHCFGCGERGDVIDFIEKIKGVSTAAAIEILRGNQSAGGNIAPAISERRDIYAGIIPLPPQTELAPDRKLILYNPKREQNGNIIPSLVHPYRRVDGSIMGYVLRHDLPEGRKETPMVQWARLPDGRECWCRLPFAKPRLLYGLESLKLGPQVTVVEGEKCRDTLFKLRRRPTVSWPGGTQGVKHTDWSPLSGKNVIIWPDADDPGRKAAAEIAEILWALGCKICVMDIFREQANERDDF